MIIRVLRIVILLSLVCFVFPWLTVSCQGRQVFSVSGANLAVGGKVDMAQMDVSGSPFGGSFLAEAQQELSRRSGGAGNEIPADPLFALTAVLALAALAATWLKKESNAGLGAAALSGAALIAAIVLTSAKRSAMMAQSEGMFSVDYAFGYPLELALLAAATGLGIYVLVIARGGQQIALVGDQGAERCPSCGKGVRSGAAFCVGCGTRIERPTCPKCAADNALGAKFCTSCGSPMAASQVASTIPAPVPSGPPIAAMQPAERRIAASVSQAEPKIVVPSLPVTRAREPANVIPEAEPTIAPSAARRLGVVVLVVALLLMVAAGAGWLYLTGIVGDRPAAVGRDISNELTSQGIAGISVSVDRQWHAVVGGHVIGQEQLSKVKGAVASHREIQSASFDGIQVDPSEGELQAAAAQALNQAGLAKFTVTITSGAVAEIAGTADGEWEVPRAIEVVRAVPGVANVVAKTQVSSAWLEREATAALRQEGFAAANVSQRGTDDVLIFGSVHSEMGKSRATEIVLLTAGRLGSSLSPQAVRNELVVFQPTASNAQSQAERGAAPAMAVPPQPLIVPPAPPPDPSAQLAGLWVGDVRQAIFIYTANLRLRAGRVGDVVGETLYGLNGTVACSGEVVLRESAVDEFSLEETITKRAGLFCPAGGNIKLHMRSARTAAIEWYRTNKPDKVAVSGAVSRQ